MHRLLQPHHISYQFSSLLSFASGICFGTAPCRFLSPVIEELAGEYAGRINFGKVDVDENPQVSSKFDIRSIPTVIMFKNGKVVDTSIGAVPKQMLEAKLKRLLN